VDGSCSYSIFRGGFRSLFFLLVLCAGVPRMPSVALVLLGALVWLSVLYVFICTPLFWRSARVSASLLGLG